MRGARFVVYLGSAALAVSLSCMDSCMDACDGMYVCGTRNELKVAVCTPRVASSPLVGLWPRAAAAQTPHLGPLVWNRVGLYLRCKTRWQRHSWSPPGPRSLTPVVHLATPTWCTFWDSAVALCQCSGLAGMAGLPFRAFGQRRVPECSSTSRHPSLRPKSPDDDVTQHCWHSPFRPAQASCSLEGRGADGLPASQPEAALSRPAGLLRRQWHASAASKGRRTMMTDRSWWVVLAAQWKSRHTGWTSAGRGGEVTTSLMPGAGPLPLPAAHSHCNSPRCAGPVQEHEGAPGPRRRSGPHLGGRPGDRPQGKSRGAVQLLFWLACAGTARGRRRHVSLGGGQLCVLPRLLSPIL